MKPAAVWQRESATFISLLGLVDVRWDLLTAPALGRLLGFPSPLDGSENTRRLKVKELKQQPTMIARFSLTRMDAVFFWKYRVVGNLDTERLSATVNGSLA